MVKYHIPMTKHLFNEDKVVPKKKKNARSAEEFSQ